MAQYYTYYEDALAAAKPGQKVDFTSGKGYYVTGTPSPTGPQLVSEHGHGQGGGSTVTPVSTQPQPAATPSPPTPAPAPATPAATQPTPAAAQPVSDAASSGGYGTTYYTYAADVPLQPGQTLGFTSGNGYYAAGTPTSPTPAPAPAPATPAATQPTPAAGQPVSDAASSGGYGTTYYTYAADVPLQPGQTLGFTSGKGYYAAGTPTLTPTTPATPADNPPPSNTQPAQSATAASPAAATTLSVVIPLHQQVTVSTVTTPYGLVTTTAGLSDPSWEIGLAPNGNLELAKNNKTPPAPQTTHLPT